MFPCSATTRMVAATPTVFSRYCALLGFKFSPRIPDLRHRRLYSFEKPSAYPTLGPLIAGRIDIAYLLPQSWYGNRS